MLKNVDEFIEIYEEEAIIVIDTNVFIDLYYFSSASAMDILGNIQSVKSNIWLPNQVIVEFFRNHKDAHETAFKKYDKLSQNISGIVRDVRKNSKSAFRPIDKYKFPNIQQLSEGISDKIDEMNSLLESYRVSISTEIDTNKELLKDDNVKVFIELLRTENRVGSEYGIKKLLDIYKEGEQRYKYLIPPGYLDASKDKKDSTKTHKFGDLIMWKQIIDKSANENKNVIFVSEDRKDDWWDNTRNLPRYELLKEFNSETSQSIVFLKLADFIKYIKIMNNIEFSISSLELDATKFIESEISTLSNGLDSSIEDDIEKWLHDDIIFDVSRHYEQQLDIDVTGLSDISFGNFYINSCDVEIGLDSKNAYYAVNLTIFVDAGLEDFPEFYDCMELKLLVDLSIETELKINEDDYENTITVVDVENVVLTNISDDLNYDIVCVDCNSRYGEYENSDGELVCESCMSDSYEVCTSCGTLFPYGSLMDGVHCERCYFEID